MDIIALFLSILDLVLLLAVGLMVKYYLPSYMSEKGKNLAKKEDIDAITHKVEGIRTQYLADIERLKSFLTVEAQLLEKRRQVYEEIAKSLRIFISGNKAETVDQERFLNAYATSWLWAPDNVVKAFNNFIELQKDYFSSGGKVSQEDLKRSYSECVWEMRKSTGFQDTTVGHNEYKFFTF